MKILNPKYLAKYKKKKFLFWAFQYQLDKMEKLYRTHPDRYASISDFIRKSINKELKAMKNYKRNKHIIV